MRQGHGKALTYYDWGATPFFALGADPRVSYCLFVPESYDEEGATGYDLVVLVHGTERGAATYRDKFAEFATGHDAIVLAPLFPCNLAGPNDLDNYKLIEAAGMRFDELLLAMVAEVRAKYRLRTDRFLMHGFSGGGHFAHRFFLLHPERLLAVSIGAPGVVTLLDKSLPWWTGVSDIEARFGKGVDVEAMRRVAVQMVVGSNDTDTWEITIPEGSSWWMAGANDAGRTRIERLKSLQTSLEREGIEVSFELVPDVAHNGWAVLGPVQSFFSKVLTAEREQGATEAVEAHAV